MNGYAYGCRMGVSVIINDIIDSINKKSEVVFNPEDTFLYIYIHSFDYLL